MSTLVQQKPVTVPWIKSQKGRKKMTMLTVYDYSMAVHLDESGIDILLVGDSVATVIYGEPNTLSITMEDMLRHTKAVSKGAKRALVVGDMPFMSYQVSPEQALVNAGRFLKEARAQAVKLEGGLEVADTVRTITRAGIPVMGHIGLTPQSINAMGSYRMFGKNAEERDFLLQSAHALCEAGAFAIVLECVEESLARLITQELSIPVIGIGAGPDCDGQVLVSYDLVGLTSGRVPKFVRPLTHLGSEMRGAVAAYIDRTHAEATGVSKELSASKELSTSKELPVPS